MDIVEALGPISTTYRIRFDELICRMEEGTAADRQAAESTIKMLVRQILKLREEQASAARTA